MSVSDPGNIEIIEKGNSLLGAVITPLRSYLISVSQKHLSPVSAAILSGFILGERRDIPDEYQSMFRNTGTLHLMAVSGSNVGLVIAIFAFPLTILRIPRKIKTVFLIAVIIFFALLTRMEPSVIRASIMASSALLVYGWVREPDYINVLGFAGLVMLMINPYQIYDLGLQLSFAAAFAIVFAIPEVLRRLPSTDSIWLKPLRWIAAMTLTTLAAQAAVMPLMARYFNNIPFVGLIANVPIGALAGFSTVLGMIFYFASILGSWAGNIAAFPLDYALEWVKDLLKLFSAFPGANIKAASPGWYQVVLYWSVIYGIYVYAVAKRVSRHTVVVSLVLANLIVWNRLGNDFPGWQLDFVDVGNNRAWVYSDIKGNRILACDFYDDRFDPEGIIISHILNFHDGEIEYIVTSTPDNPKIAVLEDQFGATVIAMDSLSSAEAAFAASFDFSENYPFMQSLSDNANVVWGKSDNRKQSGLPALVIETGDAELAFVPSEGMIEPSMYGLDGGTTLLEVPWTVYARKTFLSTLINLNPRILVFSPDRSTIAAPRSRGELTHSASRAWSTSICGGFRITGGPKGIRVLTMRQLSDKRG